MPRNRLQLSAVQGEIKGALDQVEAFCAANRLPTKTSNAMMVAMDELLSNIVKFAYGASEPGVIDVELSYEDGKLTAIVEDRGVAFNPLTAKRPEPTGELKRRSEGGLGISFVKNLMDRVEYERHGNSNKVTLMIKVTAV
jgi:anti-sigma regulatory factor (Ser/Thr protein kinase)